MPAAHLEGRRTRDCCSLSVAPGREVAKKNCLLRGGFRGSVLNAHAISCKISFAKKTKENSQNSMVYKK
jgi:hypothetical protein